MDGERVVCVKLESLADLARLASSMVTMTSSVYIVHFAHGGKHYYGVFATFRDFYKYYGVPIFYFVEQDEPLKGKYLAVKVDETGERVEVLNGVRTGWICLPIVSLVSKPAIIEFSGG